MQVFSLLVLTGFLRTSLAHLPSAPDLAAAPSYTGCPPDGPLLPRPTDLANSKYIQNAANNLSESLDAAVRGEIKAGWIVENVSFSLALVSPYGADGEDGNAKPFWEYHHRGENNERGVDKVDGDSQYLIGSVSKVFSDLVVLKSGVDLRSPVTDFLPQLASDSSKIRWEEITLEMLTDHLAGIPPNDFYEFYLLNSFHESLGLPHLNDSDYLDCGVSGLNNECSKGQLIQNFLSKKQVVPVNSRPVYSQLSFTLFTLCLEAYSGKNYSQILEETIYRPLNLVNSGVSPGNTERAVIPPGVSQWGSDYGFNAPGSGLYSSNNDISKLLSATLNKGILNTSANVRHWLKPRSTTSSLNTLVGRPWEILRTTDLLPPKHAHTIDIYGKSGGAMGYMAQIAAIDQYGVGLAVLTAGPVDSASILYRAVLSTFLPAIEEETRAQSRRYAGTWTSHLNYTAISRGETNNGTSKVEETTRLTLTLDNGPGLKLTSLTHGNASIISAIRTIWAAEFLPLGFGVLPDEDFRIYPTEIETPVPGSEVPVILAQSPRYTYDSNSNNSNEENIKLIRQEWRVNLDIAPIDSSTSDLPGQDKATQYCGSWQMVDWMTYGGIGLDKVVFVLVQGRRDVLGVEVPALRGGMLGR
ncbi:serine hydrolase domain-containing protein [Aspergillus stella-maris]|uniref:serine hydrolase domain-containing protein n=1 Tax=Aspergillus stella-maris TaxID=1810926 RepID=UPI003CCD2406